MKDPSFFKNKKKLVALAVYDAPSAALAERAGVDIVLVGDSLGMVLYGDDSTRGVSQLEMIRHTRSVRRGAPRSFLVADLPYEASLGTPGEVALEAKRLADEAGADAVKIEGPVFEVIRKTVALGVPVMAHLGLTPQTAEHFGVTARSEAEGEKLIEDARGIQAAGAFALVLECIPRELAKRITESLTIPTIGIGAGPDTDGQILVWHDLLGLTDRKPFKFVRRYAELGTAALQALEAWREDVADGRFPSDGESFHSKEGGEK